MEGSAGDVDVAEETAVEAIAGDVAISEEAVEVVATGFVVDDGGRSSAFQFNCIMGPKNDINVGVPSGAGRLIVVVASVDSVGKGVPDTTPVLITE